MLHTRSLLLGERTRVLGVVNVTPDSFSDGGKFFSPSRAIEHALRLLDEHADILDIGGESTRPGAHPQVSAQEEQDRILPVIEATLRERPEAVLSIDTYKADTARAAIAAGAEIVNDVSGFLWDPAMAATCAELQCGVVLMHTRGRSSEWPTLPPLPQNDVAPLVLHELDERAQAAVAAGVEPNRLVLDPGFGFGKCMEENYALLTYFEEFHALGYPLLAGPSRKGFLGRTLARLDANASCDQTVPADRRGNATVAAVTAAILAGAHLVRVHDIAAAREAAAIADAIRADATFES